ncbi:MAG: glycosyltransferase, partial [Gammaproteobacteria bacterium]|nr:glycosyltransferase [Gammaproteobacteria bacterium]
MDCSKKLGACLESAVPILSQYPNDYEILVKDCSSDDQVRESANRFSKILNIRYIHQSDSGIYEAWNQALSHCEGRWIYFMGADDLFAENFPLNVLMEQLRMHEKPVISIPVKYVFNTYSSVSTIDIINFRKHIRYKNPFNHQGIFHRSDILKEIGFDTSFRISGDFNTLLKMTKSDPDNIVCIEMPPMVEMHSGGISTMISTNFDRLKERAKVRKNNNIRTNHSV